MAGMALFLGADFNMLGMRTNIRLRIGLHIKTMMCRRSYKPEPGPIGWRARRSNDAESPGLWTLKCLRPPIRLGHFRGVP